MLIIAITELDRTFAHSWSNRAAILLIFNDPELKVH